MEKGSFLKNNVQSTPVINLVHLYTDNKKLTHVGPLAILKRKFCNA